nr:hypothetical protein [Nitrosomonas nitrosa]
MKTHLERGESEVGLAGLLGLLMLLALVIDFIIIVGVGIGITIIAFILSWFVLKLCRDVVVLVWPRSAPSWLYRVVLIAWLTIVPVVWTVLVYQLSGQAMTGFLNRVYASSTFDFYWPIILVEVLSAITGVWGYFYFYFAGKLKHPTWLYFMAQGDEMVFETKLSFKWRGLVMRLWWVSLKQTVLALIDGDQPKTRSTDRAKELPTYTDHHQSTKPPFTIGVEETSNEELTRV